MGNTLSDDAIDGSPAGSENAEKERKEPAREEVDIALPPEFTAKYEVVSKIGKGGFGKVYKVRDIRTKAVYAAKQLDDHESNRKEVQIQAQLDDPHVVKIFDTIHTRSRVPNAPGQLFIIMEFCDGGNLMQWINRNRKHQMLNETVILQMLQEICQAVYNCQQKRIIHRDLKPENVLLDSRRRIKLADFGVARMLDRTSVAKSFCGTPPYMAPELFLSYLSTGGPGQNAVGYVRYNLEPRPSSPRFYLAAVGEEGLGSRYDGKCDVWSIGCILWDMANLKNIFVYELGGGNQYLGYSVAQASTDSRGEREISQLVEDDIPQEYTLTKRLLHQMLKRNAQERVSLSEVLQDAELRKALENPLGGHWSDIYDKI